MITLVAERLLHRSTLIRKVQFICSIENPCVIDEHGSRHIQK